MSAPIPLPAKPRHVALQLPSPESNFWQGLKETFAAQIPGQIERIKKLKKCGVEPDVDFC
jgi:hypothetical protein